jgi:hypothetical protein
LNAEVLNILADEDSWDVRRRQIARVLPSLRQLRTKIARTYPNAPNSVDLIRADRDSR